MKKLILLLLLILMPISSCSAKMIYDNSGHISFETDNQWYYLPMRGDAVTASLLCIGLDKDTFIKFSQGLMPMRYKSMRSMSADEKSILKDSIIQFHSNLLLGKGYTTHLNKAEALDNCISAGFTCQKDNMTYKVFIMFAIKDYYAYSLSIAGNSQTILSAFETGKTLKIDGESFFDWITY